MRVSRYLLFLLFGILLTTTITAMVRGQTQTTYEFHVGAWGDSNSIGNGGVQAQIRTNIYDVNQPELGETFWIGDDLVNGAFIQFGYELLAPGSYCLYGQQIGANSNCLGSSDYVASGDVRWWWEYWPNAYATDYYSGIGQAYSAGANGTWHTYEITPNVANGWDFVLDGTVVQSFNDYPPTTSKHAVSMVAEEITSAPSASGNLGPVEFRNLAYLKDSDWQSVTSLTAISDCTSSDQLSVYPNCGLSVPYGVSLNGPNDIIAGSGQTQVLANTLLWGNPTLALQVPSPVQITLDGVTQEAGSLQLSWPIGVRHHVSVPSFVQLDTGTRLKFIDWSSGLTDPNITVSLPSGQSYSLTADYVTQYSLTVVPSLYSQGTVTWYDSGSTANFSASNQFLPPVTFVGWYDSSGNLITASSSGTILMDGPQTVVPEWQVNYPLTAIYILAIVGIAFVGISRRRSVTAQLKSEHKKTRPIEHEGPETALDDDEKAILADDCTVMKDDGIVKYGTLFLTDQYRIEFVTDEAIIGNKYVQDHYYQVSDVRNVSVENKQSVQPSLAIIWAYDPEEELTYRYHSLDDPEQWQKTILEKKRTAERPITKPSRLRKIKKETLKKDLEKMGRSARPTLQPSMVKETPKPAIQFCISCGTKLESGSDFCHKCGVKQT